MLSKAIALTITVLTSFSSFAYTANLTYNNPILNSGSGTLDVNSSLGLLSGETASFNSAILQFNFTAPYVEPVLVGTEYPPPPSGFDPPCRWELNQNCSYRPPPGGLLYTERFEGPVQSATVNVDGLIGTGLAPEKGNTTYEPITVFNLPDLATGVVTNYHFLILRGYKTWDGSFSSTVNANSTTLGRLSNTGLIDFSVLFSHAGITLDSVNLTVDYSVTAVPEPETYAMLLAGLGVMGAVARRRKAKLTA